MQGEGFEFDEEVVGGAVPKNFIPSVEKGLRQAIVKGPLAGFPVVGIRAVLYDGSSHPVDSNDMAFQTAAKIAFKNGMAQAGPKLLEPYGTLKAYMPGDNLGDIMGDVTKRRGRVLGMGQSEEDTKMQPSLSKWPRDAQQVGGQTRIQIQTVKLSRAMLARPTVPSIHKRLCL